MSLISEEHCARLVLEKAQSEGEDLNDEGADRIMDFHVRTANEQEEKVSLTLGFEVCAPHYMIHASLIWVI